MTINLNKEFITKEDILNEIQDVNVYKHYTGSLPKTGVIMKSPLRKENNPSFGYFIRNGEILFNDFVIGGGDCIKFVMLMFNLTFFEALSKIAIDFKIDDKYIVKKNIKTTSNLISNQFEFTDNTSLLENHSKLSIAVRSRKYRDYDIHYWAKYGVNIKTLAEYNVTPIDYVFINNQPIKTDKYAYAFREFKDKELTYKIYQPFNKDYKWINNHDFSVWQGWQQLPTKGKRLIITKSLKDVMSIVNNLGIPAVSLQAERTKPKLKIINELKSRFNIIDVFYDNDFDAEINWGQKFAEQLCEEYDLNNLKISDLHKCKDFSDLFKKYGKEKTIRIWDNEIDMPF